MATLDTWVKGAIETRNNLNAKDVIEIGHCLEQYLDHKQYELCNARGYKKDDIKGDIQVIEGILKKFGRG